MLRELLLMVSMVAAPFQPGAKTEVKPAEPAGPHSIPVTKAAGLPRDSVDSQPVLVGATTREAILSHRDIFRDNTSHRTIKPDWAARWRAIDRPLTLVVAFGSWCSDSQRELPEFLALTKETNPFVTIHYIGVSRDKQAPAAAWPKGIPPQPVALVPTFWLFELQPGGAQQLVGKVVEAPPKPEQGMAEAVLELIGSAR